LVKVDEAELRVGRSYISKRTGQTLTILKIEDERVYYVVDGFDTLAPLYLSKVKFSGLVEPNTLKH
jgi:hypothetical protein